MADAHTVRQEVEKLRLDLYKRASRFVDEHEHITRFDFYKGTSCNLEYGCSAEMGEVANGDYVPVYDAKNLMADFALAERQKVWEEARLRWRGWGRREPE